MTEATQTTDASTQTGASGSQDATQTDSTALNADGKTSTATDTASEGGDKAAGDKGTPEGAPETYEFKAPEGSTFDPLVVDALSAQAKDLNLSQEKAQALMEATHKVIAEQRDATLLAARTSWTELTKADKEIGGDAELAVARKAIETFGTPELRQMLNESGLGDHPEVVRTFFRVGKAISEDTFVAGGKGATPPSAQGFYAKSNMNP